ncbi:hypothetical protein RBSWK_04700 [Rhodopirellula baltica SWK14]|uniref:Uncharacterized protein n=1 Tax=Rhodopirellula baltica SWK14 TaxID=993516 RepID=L7CCL9_RHOBT|nr:hypothetical protein RBSWK_04700 [Rhodopirellula baltica SWK14]
MSPYNLDASAPTPAAPIVWAIVFKLKIAASGRSMLAFNRLKRFAAIGLVFSSVATNEGVIDSNTASATLQ